MQAVAPRRRRFPWHHFTVLTSLAFAGIFAVLPFAFAALGGKLKIPIPFPVFIILQVVQGVVIIGGAVALGLHLAPKVGLTTPLLDALAARQGVGAVLKRILPAGLLGGGITFLVLLVLLPGFRALLPPGFLESRPHISPWKGLLAALYGGIDEEILMRLFLMTLLAWLLARKWHSADGFPPKGVLWVANIAAALLFGAGHLPATATVTPLTLPVVARVVTLNASGGIIFGWLYVRRGLETAMIAHFSADVLLHCVRPLVTGT
jgi:membrane protease YdiL (CAAX protease family)